MTTSSFAKILAVLLMLPFAVTGCGKKDKAVWTQAETENAMHFVNSLQHVIEAHDIAKTAAKRQNGLTPPERARYRTLYETAAIEARIVTNDVLAKAHPDLPQQYRAYFEKGVATRISGWQNNSPADEKQGEALINRWGEWYEDHRTKIKIMPET